MAKATGPLFSLGASGTIAKALTFGNWKGIPTIRQRVTPSNPKSIGQTAQRGIMANCVAFWRSFMIYMEGKAGWNRDASASGKPQSGFNAFTSAAAKIQKQVSDASMVVGVDGVEPDILAIVIKNIDDGAAGDEAGDFVLTVGTSPTQMLNSYTATALASSLQFDVSSDYSDGDVIYAQVTKTAGTIEAAKRSGIMQITLAA